MKKIKINSEIIFTIFLPLLSLLGSFVLIASFLIFDYNGKPLEADLSTQGEFQENPGLAYFNNQPLVRKQARLSNPHFNENDQKVLSASTEEKWIEVDLEKQMLYAHQGDKTVYSFPISSGKWGRTPTGEFKIWAKLKYTLMSGGSKQDNTYYYLPNVPYTQYFHHGYGIHGTYWHNNFGHPMSHGCINMYTPDAERLFYWTNPVVSKNKWIFYPQQNDGTKVIIHGRPKSV